MEKKTEQWNFHSVTEQYMIYGTLFALANRIQTLGDGEFGDVTMKQHFLLICINVFEESPSLKEVAEFMGCTYQNVKRMAMALEKNQYVEIKKDEKDKRRLNLHLTPKAAEFSGKYEDKIKRFMEQMYEGISKEEMQTTLHTLDKMNRNLRK